MELTALIFNDLQRLEIWKISQCLCRDAAQLIVLQHPIIRKKKTLLKTQQQQPDTKWRMLLLVSEVVLGSCWKAGAIGKHHVWQPGLLSKLKEAGR